MTAVPETRTIVYRTKKKFILVHKQNSHNITYDINHNSIAKSVWGYFYSMTFKKKFQEKVSVRN